jgi:hypothetical protein
MVRRICFLLGALVVASLLAAIPATAVESPSVDELVQRLLGSAADDTIPHRFERLIAESEQDAPDPEAALTLRDVAQLFVAIGYNATLRQDSVQLRFDDDLVVGGKVTAQCTMSKSSMSVEACFPEFHASGERPMPPLHKFAAANKWNTDFRLSTAYIDPSPGMVPCLQSDLLLTKYAKANVQAVKQYAAVFAVSSQNFHSVLNEAYATLMKRV